MNRSILLQSLGCTPENTIVIGSGILDALGLRASNDIEIVVSNAFFEQLAQKKLFEQKERKGKVVLRLATLEVLSEWHIAGHVWDFNQLCQDSIIIDGVRYITVEFLCNAKTAWLLQGEFRQKDKEDLIIMNRYLDTHTHKNSCCS